MSCDSVTQEATIRLQYTNHRVQLEVALQRHQDEVQAAIDEVTFHRGPSYARANRVCACSPQSPLRTTFPPPVDTSLSTPAVVELSKTEHEALVNEYLRKNKELDAWLEKAVTCFSKMKITNPTTSPDGSCSDPDSGSGSDLDSESDSELPHLASKQQLVGWVGLMWAKYSVLKQNEAVLSELLTERRVQLAGLTKQGVFHQESPSCRRRDTVQFNEEVMDVLRARWAYCVKLRSRLYHSLLLC